MPATFQQQNRPVRPTPGCAKAIIVFASGCGVLMMVVVVLGVLGFSRGVKRTHEAATVAQSALAAIDRGDVKQFYALCSPTFKRVATEAATGAFMRKWRAVAGTIGTPAIVNERWYYGTDGARITLVYVVPGNNRQVNVTMVLSSTGGPFLVDACNFTPYDLPTDGR